jgi:hypothetical protein
MTYPSELDTDDIEGLASYIERRYPTEEIRIHNTETIHYGDDPLRLLGQIPSGRLSDVARTHPGGRLSRPPHRRCNRPQRCDPTRVDGMSQIR